MNELPQKGWLVVKRDDLQRLLDTSNLTDDEKQEIVTWINETRQVAVVVPQDAVHRRPFGGKQQC